MSDDTPIEIHSEIGPWAMVPGWVLQVGLSGSELATYVAMRTFTDRHGEGWPTVRKIAERAGVNIKTAEKAISRMRELGLLTSQRKYRADGSIAGCDYLLTDVAPREGTRETAGGGTRETAGGAPAPRPEQEHTTEHTSKNTPEELARARSGELARSLRSVPDGAEEHDEARKRALARARQERSDEEGRQRAYSAADRLAAELFEKYRGSFTVGRATLAALLREPLTNGVEPRHLDAAVGDLLRAGQKLAPWTLQEYVAKAKHRGPANGVAGW